MRLNGPRDLFCLLLQSRISTFLVMEHMRESWQQSVSMELGHRGTQSQGSPESQPASSLRAPNVSCFGSVLPHCGDVERWGSLRGGVCWGVNRSLGALSMEGVKVALVGP